LGLINNFPVSLFGWLLNKKAATVEVNISLAFLYWLEKGACRKRNWSKSSSLSLLTTLTAGIAQSGRELYTT